MQTGLTTLLVVALCLGAGLGVQAATPGRKILQTTALLGGACGAAVNAHCSSGQCCSQWGFCGVTASHCGTGCQALHSAPGSTCAGAGPTPSPSPPPRPRSSPSPSPPIPVVPPTPPPATPPAACVDSYAACPGWGPASCIYGGVPQLCPCMCGSSGGPTPPPPTPPSQPPVVPPPQPPVVPPPQPPGAGVAALISAQQWEQLFPNRNNPACQGAATNFYNYNAFLTAAATFPAFAASSPDPAVNLRELVAFLAQSSHETTGGWPTAPGGPYAWGLCFTNEGGFSPPSGTYCTPSAEWPCTPGKQYLGRGPMQLTHNYNYGPAGRALGFDGLNNPEIVATDPVLAFKAALWFWMTPQSPKPSCHDVMAGRYTPTATDIAANRLSGYGLVTNIINGGLECGQGVVADKQQSRIGCYQRHASLMGVTIGGNLDCANQQPYGQ